MKTNTKRQGHLDGLCGAYAIVNAFTELGHQSPEEVFHTACRALAPSRWPETLWVGTTLRDLETMIKACMDQLKVDDVNVSYPFRSRQPASNAELWMEFDGLFSENRRYKCAIVGLEEPSLHWLVVKPRVQALLFVDSDGLRSRSRISREKIYAGQMRNNGQEYRLNRKEVILFEKVK